MKHETGEARAHRHLREGGYVHSDAAADRKMIAGAVHKHERHDHKGEPLTKLKRGGKVAGKEADCRPDRRARGGSLNGEVHVDRRYMAEGIKQHHKPGRADGGKTPSDMDIWHTTGGWMNKKDTDEARERINSQKKPEPQEPVEERARGGKHGKHGKTVVNIGIRAGGDDQGKEQMAAQQGLRAGAALGARAAAARMGGAGGPPPGGPPPGPMAPMAGPGMPPGGAMPPHPMAGPMPPPGAMPPRPVRDGGPVRMREHAREKRVGA